MKLKKSQYHNNNIIMISRVLVQRTRMKNERNSINTSKNIRGKCEFSVQFRNNKTCNITIAIKFYEFQIFFFNTF